MPSPKWKAGSPHSWWAIVPLHEPDAHPRPWVMAATRSAAWARWRTRRPGVDARHYHAIKVVLEVQP